MRNFVVVAVIALLCASGLTQTVYDVDAVRPFQGEPLVDDNQSNSSVGVSENNNVTQRANHDSQINEAKNLTQPSEDADKTTDNAPDFAGQPTVVSAEDFQTTADSEAVVISGRIFQCRNGQADVFVDEDNKSKFTDCSLFREQVVAKVANNSAEQTDDKDDYCTGMIQFRGNTYIFDDKSPCPIPAGFFQMLTPIQATPDYYINDSNHLDKSSIEQ